MSEKKPPSIYPTPPQPSSKKYDEEDEEEYDESLLLVYPSDKERRENRVVVHARTDLTLGAFIDLLVSILILVIVLVFDNPYGELLLLQIPHAASAIIAWTLTQAEAPFYFKFGTVFYGVQAGLDLIGFVSWFVVIVDCLDADTSSCFKWLWMDFTFFFAILVLMLISAWFLSTCLRLRSTLATLREMGKRPMQTPLSKKQKSE